MVAILLKKDELWLDKGSVSRLNDEGQGSGQTTLCTSLAEGSSRESRAERFSSVADF